MPLADVLTLCSIALLTSTLTAVVGIGGGSLLIASMPGFVANSAIIPVHAVVQLFSNLSRASFGYQDINWSAVAGFAAGSLLGGVLAGRVIMTFDFDYLPLLIGSYILFTTWGPRLRFSASPKSEIVILGLVQTGLGTFVGATGPLGQSVLLNRGFGLHAIVVTSAVFMTITHATKLVVFGVLGFPFQEYWRLLVGMILATIAGSWVGTHARSRLPHWNYPLMLKVLFTVLAVRMILMTFR